MADRPGTILVVDDTEAGRSATVRQLRKLGFTVWQADSGNAALHQAERRPELIVLDVQLPDLSGFEVGRRLRENPATASVPVLYLSAHPLREDEVARQLAQGGDGYLIHPVDPAELAAAVNNLLRLRRVESALQLLAQRGQAAEATTQVQADRIEQLEQELRALERLADPSQASITAQLFGAATLREIAPEQFSRLREDYAAIMDRAIEQRNYQVNHHTSDRLRELGERLGFLQAGPRDVVELCTAALESKRTKAQPLKFQAYLEEGRLLALELMGHLTSHYRYQSLAAHGGSPRPPESRGAR